MGSETQANFDSNIADMDSPTAKKRIEELTKELNYHNNLYYNHPDSVELSDYDFDMMLKDLESLEKKYQYSLEDSPTKKVGK